MSNCSVWKNNEFCLLVLQVIPVPGCEPRINDMMAALQYIRQNLWQDVDIVNMSVGQLKNRKGLDDLLRDLAGDTVLIAAAGKPYLKRILVTKFIIMVVFYLSTPYYYYFSSQCNSLIGPMKQDTVKHRQLTMYTQQLPQSLLSWEWIIFQ